MHPGRQRPAELGDTLQRAGRAGRSRTRCPRSTGAAPGPKPLDQRPRPQQQIRGLARRQHPRGDEPRVRRRRSPAPATTRSCRPRAGSAWAGTTDRTAPRHPAPTPADQPDQGGDAPDAAGRTFSRNHDDRTRPADPLSEHRRRHLRELRQQRPHPRLERRERRRPPAPARTSAAPTTPPPWPPCSARSPTAQRSASSAPPPPPASESTPSPPK